MTQEIVLEYKRAFTEVDIILEYIGTELLDKLPSRFKEFIKRNKDDNYNFQYDSEKRLSEQNILQKTRALLSIIYRKYLITGKKIEAEEVVKINKIEEKLQQQFNADSLFENNIKQVHFSDLPTSTAMVVVKENWITKFWKKIRNLFI